MKKVASILCVVLVAAAAFYFISRGTSGEMVYEHADVLENVDVVFEFGRTESKTLEGDVYKFAYFKYSIRNQHNRKLYFHPGRVRVRYNGVVNTSTEYDSIASAMTEPVELAKGDSEYFLYLVFKKPDMDLEIVDLEILDTGIGEKPGG